MYGVPIAYYVLYSMDRAVKYNSPAINYLSLKVLRTSFVETIGGCSLSCCWISLRAVYSIAIDILYMQTKWWCVFSSLAANGVYFAVLPCWAEVVSLFPLEFLSCGTADRFSLLHILYKCCCGGFAGEGGVSFAWKESQGPIQASHSILQIHPHVIVM